MRTFLNILFFCLLASCASVTLAQTSDGQTPAEETACDGLIGAAFGLCNAYCEAMDCHYYTDGDPLTEPQATEKACDRVRDNYKKIVGQDEELPCEGPTTPPVTRELCPCFGFGGGWSDPNLSLNWDLLAAGQAGDTCTDTGRRVEVADSAGDLGAGNATAAADEDLLQCEISGPLGLAIWSGLTPGEALGCRLDLKEAFENVYGAGSCS